LLVEEQKKLTNPLPAVTGLRKISWLRLAVSLLLGAAGLWLLTRNVNGPDLLAALAQANLAYIGLGLAVIAATMLAKTARWYLLFVTRPDPPSFRSLFWILVLGQFVNALLPIRLGDIIRIYALDQQIPGNKARILGTLVVEKTLDMLTLLLTMAVLLPIVVLPDALDGKGYTLAAVALVAALGLYLLAYQTDRLTRLSERIAGRLPRPLAQRFIRLVVAGLEGLVALRNHRVTLILLVLAGIIGLLAALTPFVLFRAMGLPLGLVQAAVMNLVVTIGSVPPSTPANVFVFEALVILVLRQYGLQNDALLFSYAVIYHVVVVLPQIVIGSIAPARTNWRFRPFRRR
jgi:uncharacterized protein (TIRG00374 family)